MYIQDNAICKVCKRVFCCAKCRRKHESEKHAIFVPKSIMSTEYNQNEDTESFKGAKEALDTIYLFCAICENRPLILAPELHEEMLLHIELYHLPLRCRKCFKIYKKINDIKEFSKCIHPTIACKSQKSLASNQSDYTDEASKITVTKAAMPRSVTSQNSPLTRQDFNESHITPISIINMRWKAKSKLTQEDFISDSVSSIKNISSISNSSIRHSAGMASAVKGKVIRCSSTPVHIEMVFAKPKEQTFNASGGGHISSIQYTSACDSDNSPVCPQPNSQHLEPVNRYMRVTGCRPRMSAVTPLRQIMSKSIQKAFAGHCLPVSAAVRDSNIFHRKNIFDSSSSPEVNGKHSVEQRPLDLRLSPAVRRSQSESQKVLRNQISHRPMECNELPNLRRKILLSAQKLTTESIVITRTEHLSNVSSSSSNASSNYSLNSVNPYSQTTNSSYQSAISNNTCGSVIKSCSSVEIITATTKEIQQLKSFDGENVRSTLMPPLTPITRIPGAVVHKKIIKFETPKLELCDPGEAQNSPTEAYFTPSATPICNNSESSEINRRKFLVKQNLSGRFSPLRRPSIKERAYSTVFSRVENIAKDVVDMCDVDDEDKVSLENQEQSPKLNTVQENKNLEPRSLWSLVTSIMSLPSRKGSKESNSTSIIKRCASIAGSLVRSKSLVDESELRSLKRKRTYTTDNQSTSAYLEELNNLKATSPTSDFNTSSKRFRIQGRRPIDRMRLNS